MLVYNRMYFSTKVKSNMYAICYFYKVSFQTLNVYWL